MPKQTQKAPKTVPKWRDTGGLSRNKVLDLGDFAISYVAAGNMAAFSIFNSDCGCAETALIKGGKYYILNGDWRSDYEKLAPKGFPACLAFFKKNKAAHGSSWSA